MQSVAPIVKDFYDELEAQSPGRRQWRHAVAAASQDMLDEATGLERGRVEQARAIVLDGGVRTSGVPHPVVIEGTERYEIEGDVCKCTDYEHAPMKACRHRIALRLYKRASKLVNEWYEQRQQGEEKMTEAKLSVNVSRPTKGGGMFQITMRSDDHSEAEALGERALKAMESLMRGTAAREEPDDVPFEMSDLMPQPPKPPAGGPKAPVGAEDERDEADAPYCYYHQDREMKPSAHKGVAWHCTNRDKAGNFCRYEIMKDGTARMAPKK